MIESHKNCTCEQGASSISIISKGGSNFNLPFEQNLRRVFPLAEGLIIEFFLKQELKFNGKKWIEIKILE